MRDDLKNLMIGYSEKIYKLAFMHVKYEEDAKIIMKNTISYINNNAHNLSKVKNFDNYVIRLTIKNINLYMEYVGMVENDNVNYLDENDNIDMYKSVDLLEIEQRNAIILYYFYYMNLDKVSNLLDMSENTVKMHIRNGLKLMKESIKLDTDFNRTDFDGLDIEGYVESDIKRYIKYFSIDEYAKNKIIIPKDIKVVAVEPFLEIKKEKSKDRRYAILDLILVIIILLPVAGVIKPEIFEKTPTVYPVFKRINNIIQIKNIKSILGIKDREIIEGSIDSSNETIFIEEKDVSKPESNNEAIKLIHSLANTIVKAEYKWQCTEVTPKTIKLAIDGISKIEGEYDRMHLKNSLNKWKKGDFSNAVKVHNYVWQMLDGSVGKAEALDNDIINSITEKYYNEKGDK